MVAIYRESDDATRIRVWEADTGVERTVNITPLCRAYLDVQPRPANINELTINDYTLLSNAERVVTMSNSSVKRSR